MQAWPYGAQNVTEDWDRSEAGPHRYHFPVLLTKYFNVKNY